jgi:N-acetyl-anhydromuramoyl-L-alanine amidase
VHERSEQKKSAAIVAAWAMMCLSREGEMSQQVIDGWLQSALACPSPNFNVRPEPFEVSLLVIHNISLPPGQYGGDFIQAFFCNELDCSADPYFEKLSGLQVSAHLLIERDGRVIQFVPFDRRAWHAGVSSFDGRENCNDFSIGIELEGEDEHPYTEEQYRSLIQATEILMREYPALAGDRIVGHSTIAPGRKTDPGPAFDWDKYLTAVSTGDFLQ